MKPAPFLYTAPESATEALRLLAEHGDEAKVLAGGQSLVPAMNFRLTRPAVLVDVNGIAALEGTQHAGDRLAVGALVRHAAIERGVVPGPTGRLLSRAAQLIGHLPIRLRGTFGGSIAHADPAAEWPVIVLLLDGHVVASNAAGERVIPAVDFFEGAFTTALQVDELLTAVRLQMLTETHRAGIEELSRQAGNFALVVAAAVYRLEEGRIADSRVALAGVAGRPVRSPAAEAVLEGERPRSEVFRAAGDACAAALDPPLEDIHASAHYRRQLAGVLVRRALERAA